MPALLSDALQAELQKNQSFVLPVLELHFDAGTIRYGEVPMASDSLGEIKGRVTQWGNISRSVSDRDNALILNSTSVVLEDVDAEFSSMLDGEDADSIRGTRAVIKLVSPNVDAADWFTLFDGYVENYSMGSAFMWTLQLHPNDQPLLGVFPKTPILASDFPNVGDKTLYGEFVPVIWGIHDSRGSSDAGMDPCPYVDRINFRYLVCHGWAKDVPRVYVDGILTSASNYSITHPTINGRTYTLIDFTSDQADAEITADVDGYEETGDGSGALLTGVDAIAHLLTNFVYGDYQGGTWASLSTNISSSSFAIAQLFLEDMSWHKVSRRYGGNSQTQALAAINEFCSSLQLSAFFTNGGELAILPDDHRVTDLWFDDRWIRYDTDEVGEEGTLKIDYDRDSITDRISIQYIYDSNGGQYVQATEVRDLAITEENASALALPWSNSSLA